VRKIREPEQFEKREFGCDLECGNRVRENTEKPDAVRESVGLA
jgi:hypothetical protein